MFYEQMLMFEALGNLIPSGKVELIVEVET